LNKSTFKKSGAKIRVILNPLLRKHLKKFCSTFSKVEKVNKKLIYIVILKIIV